MAQSFVLADTLPDLGTCFVEGFDGNQMKEVLRIFDRYHVPLVIAVGYEYESSEDETIKGGFTLRVQLRKFPA